MRLLECLEPLLDVRSVASSDGGDDRRFEFVTVDRRHAEYLHALGVESLERAIDHPPQRFRNRRIEAATLQQVAHKVRHEQGISFRLAKDQRRKIAGEVAGTEARGHVLVDVLFRQQTKVKFRQLAAAEEISAQSTEWVVRRN